jgi:alpha-2-macroglobulin
VNADKRAGSKPLRGKLAATWLTGAGASGLKADVQMRLNKAPTQFERYADFTFDDPARDFAVDPVTVFASDHASLA